MTEAKSEIVVDQPRAVQAQQHPVTAADLLLHALNSGADLDRLERLMALKERHEADEARKAYVQDMAAFKMAPPEIIKDKEVGFTNRDGVFVGYKHATLGNVTGAIVEGLARHGFSHRWETEQQGPSVTVTCIITHRMGHSERTALTAQKDDSGKKNAIQQVASAITYLQRYTLLAATGLATNDQHDDDGASAEMQEMAAELRARATPVKHKIGEKGFAAALAAIHKGEYTVSELETAYELSDEQRAQAAEVAKVHQ